MYNGYIVRSRNGHFSVRSKDPSEVVSKAFGYCALRGDSTLHFIRVQSGVSHTLTLDCKVGNCDEWTPARVLISKMFSALTVPVGAYNSRVVWLTYMAWSLIGLRVTEFVTPCGAVVSYETVSDDGTLVGSKSDDKITIGHHDGEITVKPVHDDLMSAILLKKVLPNTLLSYVSGCIVHCLEHTEVDISLSNYGLLVNYYLFILDDHLIVDGADLKVNVMAQFDINRLTIDIVKNAIDQTELSVRRRLAMKSVEDGLRFHPAILSNLEN